MIYVFNNVSKDPLEYKSMSVEVPLRINSPASN